MTTLPEVMKQSDIIHQLVLDRQTLDTVGRIDQLWMYPKQHRVLGFVCQSHVLRGRKCVYKLSQLSSLGSNGILMQGEPQDTDAGTVKQLESLLGCELWSESGDRLGKILDFEFDLSNGLIQHYLWVPSQLSRLTGDLYQLIPDDVLSVGNERVLVPNRISRQPTPAPTGLQLKLKKMQQDLKADYSSLTQSFQSWMQEAQNLAVQTKEQAQTWVKQVSELDWDETLENVVPASPTRNQRSPEQLDDRDIFNEDIFEDWDEDPLPKPSSPSPSTSSSPLQGEPQASSSRSTQNVVVNVRPDNPVPVPSTVAGDLDDLTPAAHSNPTPAPSLTLAENWFDAEESLLLTAIPEADLADDDPWI